MISDLKKISTYSLQGILRYLSLRFTRKDYIVSGACHQCGGCCRQINLKTEKGWIRDEEDFQYLLTIHKKFMRFTVSGKDRQGFLLFSCSWLDEAGYCKDHENRLDICINYPAKSLMFCGGEVAKGCGYRIEKVTPFSKYLEDECQKLK
jgi:uncharacterized protein